MKKKASKIFMAVLTFLLLTLNYGCMKEKLTDEIFYTKIAYTLQLCLDDIFNQNIVGKPAGTWNNSFSGPMGGIVVITGTDSYAASVGVTTTDLTFNLQSIPYTHSASSSSEDWTSDLIFTGSITYKGTYSSSQINLSHLASNLTINGSLKYNKKTKNINNSGVVTINRSTQINGNIFGNSFTYGN